MELNLQFKGAEEFGVKFVVDPALNQYDGKVLFAESYARMDEMLSKVIYWPPEFLEEKP